MNDIFQAWLTSLIAGIGAGFTIAFIAWAVGFAIYLNRKGDTMDMEAIKTAMDTAFSGVKTDVVSMISTCTPYALTIIGTVLAVTIGISVFKKLTAKA